MVNSPKIWIHSTFFVMSCLTAVLFIFFPPGRPGTPIYIIGHFGVFFLTLLIGFICLSFNDQKGGPKKATSIAYVMLTMILVYGSEWIWLSQLKVQHPGRVPFYNRLLEKEEGRDATSPIFYHHHYLNFALNPAAAYMGEKQFNQDFLIRRSEPVRERSTVKWRALALGGSTTFGEGVAEEAGTWPYQLEQRIRTRFGQKYEVINGGVNNYNILENMIHYVTLLTFLDPDVVILFVGINDVHPRMIGNTKYDYSNSRIAWEGAYPRVSKVLQFLPFYRLQLFNRIGNGEYDVLRYVQKPYPDPLTWDTALDRNSTMVYERHLINLVRLILAQGRKVILVPQICIPRTPSDIVLCKGVAQNEEVNRRVASKVGVPYLAGVGHTGEFKESELLDNVHLSSFGGAHLADLVFKELEHNFLNVEHRTR